MSNLAGSVRENIEGRGARRPPGLASLAARARVPIDPASSDPALRRRLLGTLKAFADLPAALLDELAAQSEVLRVETRAVVFKAGEEARGIYAVCTGRVELALTTSIGEAKVLALLEPGSTFGEAACFLSARHPMTAVALESCTLIFLPREIVQSALTLHPVFSQRMLTIMSKGLLGLVVDISGYTQHNAEQRVADFLLRLLEQGPRGTLEITLPTTKQRLASRLSITPETLSRTLRRLREQAIVKACGRKITVLDRDALRALAV
jgi:CRP-like cAMP-binding protein